MINCLIIYLINCLIFYLIFAYVNFCESRKSLHSLKNETVGVFKCIISVHSPLRVDLMTQSRSFQDKYNLVLLVLVYADSKVHSHITVWQLLYHPFCTLSFSIKFTRRTWTFVFAWIINALDSLVKIKMFPEEFYSEIKSKTWFN